MSDDEGKRASAASEGKDGDDGDGELDMNDFSDADVKIILLGDSAVGKSKLMKRFLMDDYKPRQLSTFALTLYRYNTNVNGKPCKIDFWDTAGQERFQSLHPSYYFGAKACVMVFDVTRKLTYQHLSTWYKELRQYCEDIPCYCVANKIDVDYKVTKKKFAFPKKHGMTCDFVSAADGTNVVKIFKNAIRGAIEYKESGDDFMSEALGLLKDMEGDEDDDGDGGGGGGGGGGR